MYSQINYRAPSPLRERERDVQPLSTRDTCLFLKKSSGSNYTTRISLCQMQRQSFLSIFFAHLPCLRTFIIWRGNFSLRLCFNTTE